MTISINSEGTLQLNFSLEEPYLSNGYTVQSIKLYTTDTLYNGVLYGVDLTEGWENTTDVEFSIPEQDLSELSFVVNTSSGEEAISGLIETVKDKFLFVEIKVDTTELSALCLPRTFTSYILPNNFKCKLYNKLKQSLFKINPNCSEGINVLNDLLEYQMFNLSLDLGKMEQAMKLYIKLMNNYTPTTNNCNCNGNL